MDNRRILWNSSVGGCRITLSTSTASGYNIQAISAAGRCRITLSISDAGKYGALTSTANKCIYLAYI